MLEEYVSNIIVKEKEEKKINFSFADSAIFNPSIYKDKIKNIDIMSDKELFDLINSSYTSLLDELVKGNDPSYVDIFTNQKFLTVFIRVMSNVTLNDEYRLYCNKLAYDYIALKKEGKDENVKNLLLLLSKVVNKDLLPALLGLGIPDKVASYLILCRYSSRKEIVNVKRLNFMMVGSGLVELFTEQTIVYIYEKLFKSFTLLFEGTMFDVDTIGFSENMDEIYSTISLAVLDLLENMTTDNIRKVLISYEGDYKALYSTPGVKTIRFSMYSVNKTDYPRINNVLDLLQNEGIYIP